jgi:hypothetical protein
MVYLNIVFQSMVRVTKDMTSYMALLLYFLIFVLFYRCLENQLTIIKWYAQKMCSTIFASLSSGMHRCQMTVVDMVPKSWQPFARIKWLLLLVVYISSEFTVAHPVMKLGLNFAMHLSNHSSERTKKTHFTHKSRSITPRCVVYSSLVLALFFNAWATRYKRRPILIRQVSQPRCGWHRIHLCDKRVTASLA